MEAQQLGTVKIANEVVAMIAGAAVAEVSGVVGTSGGVVSEVAERLGRKSFAKGIKVEAGEKEALLEIAVVVKYGVKIPEVATLVQEKVKQRVEEMTGLKVKAVNIQVQGITFPGEETEGNA